jgi:hypothetical protein
MQCETSLVIADFKVERLTWAKECMQTLEAVKRKKINFPLEPAQRTQLY